MAVVPQARVTENLRPLNPGYQTPRATEADFGGNRAKSLQRAGAALAQAGDTLGDKALVEQREDNDRAAKDLEVKYRNQVNQVLYGDGTADNRGYMNEQGENAVKNHTAAQAAIDKIRANLLNEAGNDRVKESFGLTSTVLGGAYNSSMSQHASEQRDVASDAASQARASAAVDSAFAAWNDMDMRATSLAIARNEALDTAERKGFSEDQTTAAVKSAQTQVFSAIVQGALAENPDEALVLYNKYKPGMDAQVAAALGRQVQEVSTIAVAQSTVGKIMGEKMSRSDARQKIRDLLSGKQEDAAIAEYNQRMSEVDADFNRAQAFQAAADREIDRQWTLSQRAKELATESAKDKVTRGVRGKQSLNDVLSALTPEESTIVNSDPYFLTNMQRIETANIEGSMFSKTTDGHTLKDVRSMDDASRANYDIEGNRALFTEQEYTQASSLVAASVKKVQSIQAGEVGNAYGRADTVLRNFAPNKLEWGLKDQSPKNEAVQKAVTDQMSIFIQERQADGKVPTDAELRQKAQELLIPVYNDEFGRDPMIGTSGLVRNMTDKQIETAYVPVDQIPQQTQDGYKSMAKGIGVKAPSELTIGKLYAAQFLPPEKARARIAALLGTTPEAIDAYVDSLKAQGK